MQKVIVFMIFFLVFTVVLTMVEESTEEFISSSSSSSSEEEEEFVCPSLGDFSDPNSNGYFHCAEGSNKELNAFARNCPHGLRFNGKIYACDFPDNFGMIQI